MIVKHFDHFSMIEQRAAAMLEEHFGLSSTQPHAVILTGGKTPLGLYGRLENSPPRIDDQLHLLLSDERHVPSDSPEHNFAQIRPMIDALGVDDARVIRVNTRLPLEAAARRYHEELAAYFDRGGRITLGILGLGADGHVASLFTPDDVQMGTGRFAIAVRRKNGPHRISVTRDLLLKAKRLVFLVRGAEKAQVVERLANDPTSVAAGRIVRDAPDVQVWFSK